MLSNKQIFLFFKENFMLILWKVENLHFFFPQTIVLNLSPIWNILFEVTATLVSFLQILEHCQIAQIISWCFKLTFLNFFHFK